jgi:signal transduction histidine kinase
MISKTLDLPNNIGTILFQWLMDSSQELVMLTNGATIVENATILGINSYFESITGLQNSLVTNLLVSEVIANHNQIADFNNLSDLYKEAAKSTVCLPIKTTTNGIMLIDFCLIPLCQIKAETYLWLWIGRAKPAQNLNIEEIDLHHKISKTVQAANSTGHDLNNILAIIVGHTDLMLSNLPPNSPFIASLESISRATAKGIKLAQTLLKLNEKT